MNSNTYKNFSLLVAACIITIIISYGSGEIIWSISWSHPYSYFYSIIFSYLLLIMSPILLSKLFFVQKKYKTSENDQNTKIKHACYYASLFGFIFFYMFCSMNYGGPLWPIPLIIDSFDYLEAYRINKKEISGLFSIVLFLELLILSLYIVVEQRKKVTEEEMKDSGDDEN